MSREARTRKALFKAAVELAGTTMSGWAEEQGISRGHLYQVLDGRESARLCEKIDAFIAKHVPERGA